MTEEEIRAKEEDRKETTVLVVEDNGDLRKFPPILSVPLLPATSRTTSIKLFEPKSRGVQRSGCEHI